VIHERKLTISIELFKHYYVDQPEFYSSDERKQKELASKYFKSVFRRSNIESDLFLPSLIEMFSYPNLLQAVIWLGGGAFYQSRTFIDYLSKLEDDTSLKEAFLALLYSQRKIGRRINDFKSHIDLEYRSQGLNEMIQLNLISQFLGLSYPDKYCIYKSTEHEAAARYFEYSAKRRGTSAGEKYEYFAELSSIILRAMHKAGLKNADFIDVHTFVYRDDWYRAQSEEELIVEFDQAVEEAEELSDETLIERIRSCKPKPPRLTSGKYYYRDPHLAVLVKRLADGICDLCKEPAPFINKSGQPYLESHHIVFLSIGGRDKLTNCVSLCPNCHRKMHILDLVEDKAKLQAIADERSQRLGDI
jgi:5-methylcytosine-specific restriction endonuclease McrA